MNRNPRIVPGRTTPAWALRWLIVGTFALTPALTSAKQRDSAGARSQAEKGRARVVFVLSKARGKGDFVYCGLFNSKKRWPRKQIVGVRGKVNAKGKATCTFEGVRPGTYAIAAFHDANGNQELDTNWVGIPREGWCTSRNVSTTWGAPKWDSAKFEVAPGAEHRLRARINY